MRTSLVREVIRHVDALAQIVVTIDLPNEKAEADITLPNPGGGTYHATLELEFHEVANLTEACLGISAVVLQGASLAAVEARLPLAAGNFGIDPAFPVMITVEPPVNCGLAFSDDVHIEIHTENLVFTPESPYRLMKAPIGSAFREITNAVLAGSVRTRGSGGRFSELVIAKSLISDAPAEALLGFDDLRARITQADLSLVARKVLDVHYRLAKAAYDNADYSDAIARIVAMEVDVESLGGTPIPNRWRSQRDLVNAEGEIQGLASSLRHRIQRVIDAGP
jgi:hypothetical protein